ncbi:MAG: hypothetical protein COU28_02180 [Candidatus Magasanikbacteria bacterium CG10_big_fil_rev_8_21_14_0_10_36_16]|uniref:Uncharacterized protein n=1 Tax=Candidatus Magasanikbacteria bacterium CG10_big_fil_rev_8_21_14_0_10_36_16 TaxID=1974645 RepID=A0A2H0U0J2_9BACT|nr:MAG: hypothetical protein COU28_02180 [Candidatus Magasanikbacteria bacterium CG10_big_fil_rev_8_21_14_0_10_36_16]
MENPQILPEKKKSILLPVLLTVLITTILVGGGIYGWLVMTKPAPIEKVELPITEMPPVINTETQNTENFPNTIPQKNSETVNQDGVGSGSPLWSLIKTNLKDKIPNETIQSFGAPQDPNNNDIIYISTSGDIVGEWPDVKSTNKIYSYNIITGKLTKIYEEQESRTLHTVAIEGSKVIILYDPIDNSPGPCGSIWAGDNFGYMDINNPSQLQPFTVPDYLIQQGKDEQVKCEAEMGLDK